MKKQLKLFILTFILFSTSIGAVESLQQLCAQKVAQRLVSDAMLEQFKNNPHFIQEKGLNHELQDMIKTDILSSYRPTPDALRLTDWILSISTVTPTNSHHQYTIPSRRSHENHYALLDTLPGYNDRVTSIAWSPNGDRIAGASDEGIVQIWNAQNGTLLHFIFVHKGPVYSVAWSPNGKRIATASFDKTAKIWCPGPVTGNLLHTLTGHNSPVLSVDWSPNGNRITTASSDHTEKIWDLPQLQKLSLEQALFLALVYHHNHNGQSLILNYDHEHLHNIYRSLPADIQNNIKNKIRSLKKHKK